jgi:hypothetical protein
MTKTDNSLSIAFILGAIAFAPTTLRAQAVPACQAELGKRISQERGLSSVNLTLGATESAAAPSGQLGVRGSATLATSAGPETISFDCRVDARTNQVVHLGYSSSGAKPDAAAASPKALDLAAKGTNGGPSLKACQETIRNKIREKHGDKVQINFETVEVAPLQGDIEKVTGRVRMSLGGDSTTFNYICRVDAKQAKVNRAEYAQEK